MRHRHPLARCATAKLGGACSEVPEARSFRLRGVKDRIAASYERIEPVRLGSGPLDPLLLLGRELIVVARSILDGGDELAQTARALQPARVAKQDAQLAMFLVARADLRFVSGARFLVGPPAALLFLFLRAFRFCQADDGSDDAAQARVDEAAFRVVPLP